MEIIMAKISVYLNSHSSQGLASYNEEELKKFFFRHELQVKRPHSLDELHSSLENEMDQGTEYIFAAGGDGTMNAVSQRLINKNIKLMILPAGTANDFAQELGVTNNLKKITQIFNAQTTKRIDAIHVNGRIMMTNGGIGMACEVAATVDRMRKTSPLFKKMMKTIGKETYSLVYAQQMLMKAYKKRRVYLHSKDSPLLDPRIESPMILVNNQEFIGGKFQVAPKTLNDDGKFNVTIFLHQNRLDFLKCTLMMMQGKFPKNDPNLISFETDELNLMSLDQEPIRFFGDGEIFDDTKELKLGISQQALEVCTYKGESLLCSGHSLDKIEMIQ
jgi:YegS/Rv2252/BmrU family lipid kinase